MKKWLQDSPGVLKGFAFFVGIVFFVSFAHEAWTDGELEVGIGAGAVLGVINYYLTLIFLRLAYIPFQAVFLTARFGYRSAVVASRLGALAGAREEALGALAGWDCKAELPRGALERADWPSAVGQWRQGRVRIWGVPALAGLVAWLVIVQPWQPGSPGWVESVIYVCVAAGATGLLLGLKTGRETLGERMVTLLADALAEPARRPGKGTRSWRRESWDTPLGQLGVRWSKTHLELEVRLETLAVDLQVVSTAVIEKEADDLDFGDPRFDGATIALAKKGVPHHRARGQLNARARRLVLGLLEAQAMVDGGVKRAFYLARGDAPAEIRDFILLAGGLATLLGRWQERSVQSRALHALDTAVGPEEQKMLIKSLGGTRRDAGCKAALRAWVERSRGETRICALEAIPPIDRRALVELILADEKETLETRADALGVWLEGGSPTAVERVLQALEEGDHQVVGTMLARRMKGDAPPAVVRGVSEGLLRDELRAPNKRRDRPPLDPLACLLAAQLVLRLGEKSLETVGAETVRGWIDKGAESPTADHLRYLEAIVGDARDAAAILTHAQACSLRARERFQMLAAQQQGQLSLAVAGEEGGLSVISEDQGGEG